MKDLIKRIEELFEQKLQAKTGWGRNEIMAAYRDAQNQAYLEYLTEVMKEKDND